MTAISERVGISGFAVYVPPYRVDLRSWCGWTDSPWDKTQAVIGRSFRMRGPAQSVYTIAATAVMRLIEQYDIDPRRVGFLGLGTESSTDNSAGAVIIKGMVDEALEAQGRSRINRNCEVPEIKHACLGGIYSLKHALRYLALEQLDRCAIVVSADIAEYERGSSGEPTQGAGAVAMLVERNPKMLSVNLAHIGSASSYRAVDFRKPVLRNIIRGTLNCHFQDLPVFNGKYSTTCYLDETLHALDDMLRRMGTEPAQYYRELAAVFMHRPYHRMPESSFAMSYLFALGRNGVEGRAVLEQLCQSVEFDVGELIAEMKSQPDILQLVKDDNVDADAYPLSIRVLREFRASSDFAALITSKMSLGSEAMKDVGNVYCAALPAWLAAGMEDAWNRKLDLSGGQVLAVGYGSGDAAEALPMTVCEDWVEAAARIGFSTALSGYQDLNRSQYESLHDTGEADSLGAPEGGFVIDSIGNNANPNFSDDGIEYYRFVR
ncbi:hydroxymethylglutaryl-CoA synthase [Candidatus Rariloculus sp.]|uniref:hydroxymethylglutaryl-CoA synthase n=1 Tax=Candidatus Rariloculus sp. TaxID=3101265 RepID=UPI003D0A8455